MDQKRHRIGIDARLFGTAHTGIGMYTEELIGNLLKIDTHNQYVVFALPEIVHLFPFYSPNLEKKAVDYKHYSYSEQLFLPGIINKAKVDLVHYTNFNTPVLWGSVKSVVTVHDLTLLFHPGRSRSKIRKWVYRYVIKRTCERATRIIAVSKATKDDIVNHLGIDPNKIDVVYEAASQRLKVDPDPKKIEAIKTKYDITKPFFMYVGQWRTHKNLVRLIRAFAEAKRRYQLDYQLVLVGREDPLAPEIKETISSLGLQNDVLITGYVADGDMGQFFAAAEAFIYPSLYEGFGIPPLEAMSAGTPVLTSNVSVMPEILGDAALYFDPYSVEDMADKMYQFANSYRLKQELKEKGIKRARTYSFSKMAKATLEIYEKVLGGDR